jgi:hypothetical protein
LASDVLNYPAAPPPIGSPVYAPASMITGDATVGLTYYAEPDDDYSVWDIFGSGRINVPLGGGPWYITGEIFGLAALNEYKYREFLGAAHLYHKTPQYAHGVYVAGLGYSEVGFNGHELQTGVEGAAFLGQFTLTGALGYTWGDNDDGAYSGWDVLGMATYYLTPNTSLAGAVELWGSGSGWALGARAEHMITGTDMSVFGNASWATEDGDEWWQATAGLRFFFHNPNATLQQHDWDIPFGAVVF